MKTKLILFYGPGSGSGKSTLSRLIHDGLQQKGVETKYVAESDVLHLDAFVPYVEEVKQNNPGDVQVLLSSCKRFIDACTQSDQGMSWIPFFHALIGSLPRGVLSSRLSTSTPNSTAS